METTYNAGAARAIVTAALEWMESTGGGTALFMDAKKVQVWGMPNIGERCPACGEFRRFVVTFGDLAVEDWDVEEVAAGMLSTMRQARTVMDGESGPCCN